MPTITISGTLYEVYGGLTEANTYFSAASQGAPWLAADSSFRNQLLVTATRVFERTGWQGQPTEPVDKTQPQPPDTQPLQWPRTGLQDRNGVAVPPTITPQDVVNGNFEYALTLLNDPAVQTASQTGSNLKSDELTQRVEGAVTKTTKQSFFVGTLGKLPQFPATTQDYIGIWLAGSNFITGFASGADQVSQIEGVDFGFNVGGIP